jgi:predicted ATPase/class 3 adenylate cyclase
VPPSPPSGTVTFLFTDIEGSTGLWDAHPEAMRPALARHDALLRAAVADHGGTVFSTGGDGLAAVFGRAGDAVAAALQGQQALAGEAWAAPVELRVRMAMHTGEADERDGDYFGPAVNRAARLMATARGGEVLVSLATAEVVRWQLPEGVSLVDVGEVELRGLRHPEHVWQLVWPGAPMREAAPAAARAVGNLPRVRPLLGREREEADVRQLVAREPLVTLTGPGGVGKTSLALSVAAAAAPAFADGVWSCELASVLVPGEVAQAVGETLGLRPQQALSPLELLVRALSHQACLLVLDNCEHVVDAAAELAEAVVARCPDVRVLATSREALGVPGERVVAVSTLDADAAAALFRSRASEHGGGFDPDDDHLVAELCAALDGLPLAVELAAARSRSMPLADLLRRLDARFRLLHGPRRVAERHQTLRATVAWSYDLLAPDERRLFDRLSVFAGGFDLAAAEAVCADAGLDAVDVDRLVGALVDKSMVLPAPGGRYVLLETLRQFGEERLAESGDIESRREAHLRWFTSFVVAAHDGLQGADQGRWWSRLQADWANVRSAYARAFGNGDVDAAATITSHLIWVAAWHDTGEPCLWFDAVAGMPGVTSSRHWANLLTGRAWAAWVRGDLMAARAAGHEALANEQPGAPNIDLIAEFCVYSAAFFTGDRETLFHYLEQGADRARQSGNLVVESINWSSWCMAHGGHRDYEAALSASRRALELAELAGNPNAIAWALSQMAMAMTGLHDGTAMEVVQRSIAIASDSGAVMALFNSNWLLSQLHLTAGRRADAAAVALGAMRSMRRKAAWMYAQQIVVSAASILRSGESWVVAAKLLGAASRSPSAGGPHTQRFLASLAHSVASEIGPARFAELRAAGEALSVEDAVLLAEQALTELIASAEGDPPQG